MNPWKTALVIFVAVVTQVCLFSRFSFEGARPDVVVLVAVAAGFVCGADRGALVGFAAGLSIDVLLTTPLGLSALVFTLVGYSVGAVAGTVVRATWWVSPVVVGLGSAVGTLVYALVGEVFGVETLAGPSLTTIVVVVALVNAALAPLAVRALRWARSDDPEHRRYPSFAR